MRPVDLKMTRAAIRSSVVAERMIRLLVGFGGFYLIAAFPLCGQMDASMASLCIIAFVLGGVRVSVGAASSDTELTMDAAGAVAFGAAVACGPWGAAGPAAMAALGGMLLGSEQRESFWCSAYRVARVSAQAAIAGFAFVAAGGNISTPTDAASLAPAVVAAATYAIADRAFGNRRLPMSALGITLGFGYALGGAVRAVPSYAVLVPALPLALALRGLLRRQQESVLQVVEQAEEAKPSLLDQTTGLANQRYLDMFMLQEISRADRSGQPITVMLIDIDNFRQLNDSDGTDSGDRFMAALGDGFKGMIRDYDVVARYKDDEFVVVLPETDAESGSEIAHRLHESLSGQIVPWRAKFSVGVATYPTHGASVDNLLSSAHHALNRAKFSGKNTVRTCQELAKAS